VLLTPNVVDRAHAQDPPDEVTVQFDHFSTGFPLDGAHRSVSCDSCHTNGKFQALPTQCRDCHNDTIAPGKPFRHIPTNADCESCHVTASWSRVRFDHSTATATCANCHNNSVARGKTANHIQTNATCDNCHVTSNWTNVRFDHADVTGSCASCHNGSAATGKPAAKRRAA
jgi:hypothetical protein